MSAENLLWGAPRIHGELLEARLCGGSVDRRQIHGQEERPIRAKLGHVFAQPCATHRSDGPVRGRSVRAAFAAEVLVGDVDVVAVALAKDNRAR